MKNRIGTFFSLQIFINFQAIGVTSLREGHGAILSLDTDNAEQIAREYRYLNSLNDDVFVEHDSEDEEDGEDAIEASDWPTLSPTLTMKPSNQPSDQSSTSAPSDHPQASPSKAPSLHPHLSNSTPSSTNANADETGCTVTNASFGSTSLKSLVIPYKYEMDYKPAASNRLRRLIKNLEQAIIEHIVQSTVLFDDECQRRILAAAVTDQDEIGIDQYVVGITSNPGGAEVEDSYCGDNCLSVEARLTVYLTDEDGRKRHSRQLTDEDREEIIMETVTSSIESGMQGGDLLLLTTNQNIVGLRFISSEDMDVSSGGGRPTPLEDENVEAGTKANGAVSATASVAIASMAAVIGVILTMKYRKRDKEDESKEGEENRGYDTGFGTSVGLGISSLDDSNIMFRSPGRQHILTPIREHEDDLSYDESCYTESFDQRLIDDGSISMSFDNTRNFSSSMENTFTDIDLDMDAQMASSVGRKRKVQASRIGNTVVV